MAVPFTLLVLLLLLVAAWHDVATRTIPDLISLLIAAAGTVSRLLDGPLAWAFSAAAALMLFSVLLVAFSRGLIGGGDVKIMTALAIALPPLDTYRFAVATAVAGGFLAVAYLTLSCMLRPPHTAGRHGVLGRVAAIESWRIRRRASLPYGVAIAVGGAFVLLHRGGF